MRDDDDLAAEVRRLRREITALQRRVAALEEGETDDRDAPPSNTGAASPATGIAPSTADDAQASEGGATATPGASAPAPETARSDEDETADDTDPARTPDGSASGRAGRDWERDIGIKWLGLAGGLALVVGVVFFVRLAIDAGLLGPLGRVTVGTLGGLALFAVGRYAAEHQGYPRWGRIAAGVGLAITYFSVYVSYGLETYRSAIGTPLWAVLLALSALVAATIAISVRDRAPTVAGEAFLLGYVTAFVGLEAGTFVLTPAYGLLLAIGLVGVATVRPWSRLLVASVLPTYAVLGAWIVDTDPAPALVTGVVVVAFAIYVAGDLALRAGDRADRSHRLQVAALTALNAAVAAPILEVNVREWFPSLPLAGGGFVAVGLALAGVYALTTRRPVRRDDTAGGLAVVYAGIGVVLALNVFAATVGLLAVVCGAVAVAARADAEAFRTGAHVVAVGTVLKLLVVDAAQLPAADPAAPAATATGRASAYLLAIVVLYGLAWWFRTRDLQLSAHHRRLPLAAPYAWSATGLTVVLLGLELSGASISVAWAVFGLALVAAGLARDVRGLRLQGVAVLAIVTAKVFLYDTQDLDALARTLSFLTLGAILLVAAYGYARTQGEDPLGRLTEE